MEDTASCSSRAVESSPPRRRKQRQKVEVYLEVLARLRDSNEAEAAVPGFEDELWDHFHKLPNRYALDVNAERAEDVLLHKTLLRMAHDPATRPAIDVRLVQVRSTSDTNCGDFAYLSSAGRVEAQCSSYFNKPSIHPPPAFGLSSHLELEVDRFHLPDGNSAMKSNPLCYQSMYEITISTNDKPKLLSQLTSLLSDVGLNIQEAHAFSTTDGYSLDVFLVDGWALEETEQLRNVLIKEIPKVEKDRLKNHVISAFIKPEQVGDKLISDHVNTCTDVWEIDVSLLKFEKNIATGSYGDLYKGTFHSQDVAIKVLRAEQINEKMQKEFAQEVYIMRKIRHKNVVQFIGACTRPPSLCIVTEFMSGGSVYDFLHKQKGIFDLSSVLRMAVNVAKGMNYLHQNNIIHRDLKAANLLMDENEVRHSDGVFLLGIIAKKYMRHSVFVALLFDNYKKYLKVHLFAIIKEEGRKLQKVVKIADFGVARVQAKSGVMTAETGSYRWMAPEVIEHKPYDHRADIFSFGIVLWEILTGKLPYEDLTPIQAVVGVVRQGLRPIIPSDSHPKFEELLKRCWQQDPSLRPEFSEIIEILQQLSNRAR